MGDAPIELMNCVSESELMTAPPPSRRRLRILFLGNAYNPFSVQCALALARTDHQVTVAAYEPASGKLSKVAADSWRKFGAWFVLRKAATLLRCRVRLWLRRLGFRFQGSASLSEVCLQNGLPTLEMSNPNSAPFLAAVREAAIDLVVVAAFSRILKRDLIEAPPLGCLNLHPSLLPQYRGPNPIYWALARRERVTGVTAHFIDQGIDTGPILLQRELEILRGETEASLMRRCAQLAAALLPEALALVADGKAVALPQDETRASYFPIPPRGASTL
ncbi:MAG: methionyl-tRNA formyltransferase [Candidatus Acidiferrales bacterium]